MSTRWKKGAVAAVATLSAVSATAATSTAADAAQHRGQPVKVLASGLAGPFGLQSVGKDFVVAESGKEQVTGVDRHGHMRVLISGAPGVSGVAAGYGYVFGALGGPNEEGSPPSGGFPATSIVRATAAGKHAKAIANLQDYELAHNPDGQVQFAPDGTPYDALSNPFSMTGSRRGLLVADGGGNDVLLVNPITGHVSTFFVPPTVTDVPACLQPGAQANPGTTGCDSVPTGVAVVRSSVYVSTLGAGVPGAGKVYKLSLGSGHVQRVWSGFTGPTGIAVARNRTIYLSEATYGAPEDGSPPADPSKIGRITKVAKSGKQTHLQVTTPTGLDYRHGKLFASVGSLAPQGAIVRINKHAFH